ncbi:MAG: hypothetical protein ACLQQ0_02725, partial [Limisphaerales bacterium]
GGGGGKSPAKGLNRAGEALFSFSGPRIYLCRCPYSFHLYPKKIGAPNFRITGKSFSPQTTRPAPEFLHSLSPSWTTTPGDRRAAAANKILAGRSIFY